MGHWVRMVGKQLGESIVVISLFELSNKCTCNGLHVIKYRGCFFRRVTILFSELVFFDSFDIANKPIWSGGNPEVIVAMLTHPYFSVCTVSYFSKCSRFLCYRQ